MGLLDDIELFARSQAEMDAARVDAERKLAEQYGSLAAYTGAQFAPGSATLEARGGMAQPPELGLPVSDLPKYMVEAEKLPGMAEIYDVFQSADPYMEQPSAGYVPKRPMPNPEAQQSALDLLLLGMGVTGDALQAGGGAAGAIAGGALKIPRAIQKFNRLINNYNADPFGFRSKLIEELRIAKNEGMTFQNFQALENYLKKKGVKPEEINTMFQLRNMSQDDQFVRFSPGQEYSKKIDPGKVLDNAAFDSPNRRTLITEEAYGGILQQKVNEKDGKAVTPVIGKNQYTDQGFYVLHPREIDEQYLGQDLNDQAYVLSFNTKLYEENPVTNTDFTGFMDDQSQHWFKDYYDGDEKINVGVPRRDILGHYRTTDRIYMDPDSGQPKRILFLEEVQSDFIGNLNNMRSAQKMRKETEKDLENIAWIEGDQDVLRKSSFGEEDPQLMKRITREKRDRLLALVEKLRGKDAPNLRSRINIPSHFEQEYDLIFQLAEELDIDVDNTGGFYNIDNLSALDQKIHNILTDMRDIAKETEIDLQKRTSVAPFVKDPKKMYDALVKRIKMRAYRQGYDGIALAPGEVHVDRWAGSGLHTDKQKEGMRKIYSDLIQPRINKAMGHKADGTMKMENPDEYDSDVTDSLVREGKTYNAPVWLFAEDDLKKIETEGVYEYKDGGAVNKIVNDVDIFS
tara:strand:- start:249 stop:2300 length:2052 start_codon:yes stop_codon:yes gene_type:complete